MALQLRRVVTGHDNSGKAVVTIDEPVKNIMSGRPGAQASVVWTTQGFPVSNDGAADDSQRKVATTLDGGTVFRVVEFSPGVERRMHRTDFDRLCRDHVRRDRHGARRHHRPSQGRRRAGTARHHSQLAQPRHGALHHRLHPDRRQAGRGRRQGAARRWLSRRAAQARCSHRPPRIRLSPRPGSGGWRGEYHGQDDGQVT